MGTLEELSEKIAKLEKRVKTLENCEYETAEWYVDVNEKLDKLHSNVSYLEDAMEELSYH